MSFTRSDDFMKPEKGGEWFDDLLKQLATTTDQEITSIITGTQMETVESLTEKYKEQVGLNLIAKEESKVITASVKNKPLSKRAEVKKSIKDLPQVQQAVDSFCQHTGGTKSTHSIINNLRKMLGKENVSYTDQELLDYINERKKQFYTSDKEDMSHDIGAAGTDKNYTDDAADYANRGVIK